MRTILSIFITCLMTLQCMAEKSPKGNHISRILGNSHDLALPNVARLDIRAVNWKPSKGAIEIRVNDGENQYLDIHHFWGYQLEDEEVFRFFEGSFYKVEQIGKMLVYSQENYVGDTNNTLYFFSETPDSPILWMSRQNLKMVYHDRSCLIEHLESLSWTKPIASYSKKDHKFMIESWLEDCE